MDPALLLLRKTFGLSDDDWKAWVPSNNVSRQDWQNAVESMVAEIRVTSKRPAFGLSESEISVHYHLPLARTAVLIRQRLG